LERIFENSDVIADLSVLRQLDVRGDHHRFFHRLISPPFFRGNAVKTRLNSMLAAFEAWKVVTQ